MDLHHITLFDAEQALRENATKHLNAKSTPALHNLNIALLGICNTLERLKEDVGLLHNKLQPILKSLSDDQADWQSQVRR